MCIAYDFVTPLNFNSPPLNITKREVINKVNDLVRKMHELGYGHGDLHMDNNTRR